MLRLAGRAKSAFPHPGHITPNTPFYEPNNAAPSTPFNRTMPPPNTPVVLTIPPPTHLLTWQYFPRRSFSSTCLKPATFRYSDPLYIHPPFFLYSGPLYNQQLSVTVIRFLTSNLTFTVTRFILLYIAM